MRKALVCLLAAAAALAPAGMANADPYTYTHAGRCELDFPRTIDQGFLYAAVVVFARPVKPNLVSADVTCSIRVGSFVAFSRTSSGTFVVEQDGLVNFPSSYPDDQIFTICTEVDFTSSSAPTETDCYDMTRTVASQEASDLVESPNLSAVDPWLCPMLAVQHGAVSVVTITEEGDVWLSGRAKIKDCPPYGP